MYFLLFFCFAVLVHSKQVCGTFSDFCAQEANVRGDVSLILGEDHHIHTVELMKYVSNPSSCYLLPPYGIAFQTSINSITDNYFLFGQMKKVFFIVNNVEMANKQFNCSIELVANTRYDLNDITCKHYETIQWDEYRNMVGNNVTYTVKLLSDNRLNFNNYIWSYANDDGCIRTDSNISFWIVLSLILVIVIIIGGIFIYVLIIRSKRFSDTVTNKQTQNHLSESQNLIIEKLVKSPKI